MNNDPRMLKLLKESAASGTTYIRMSDLQPGRYGIRKFYLRDSQFGKRMVIEIDRGLIFLPQKMLKKINTEKGINKLNKDHYDLVYEGQDDRTSTLNFTFEKHGTFEEEEDDDDNMNDSDNDKSIWSVSATSGGAARKQKKK